MLPIPREDGIACKNCPFFGNEGVAVEVGKGSGRNKRVFGVVIIGTCRVERPEKMTGEVDLAPRATALCGVARIGGHLWVPEDYWCGRHPKIRCPNECGYTPPPPPKPKATHIVFGKASLEPATPQPKGT